MKLLKMSESKKDDSKTSIETTNDTEVLESSNVIEWNDAIEVLIKEQAV